MSLHDFTDFAVDFASFAETSAIMNKAIQKAKDAKDKWLESSFEKLLAGGCTNLAIEEHPTKTVITCNGEPVGTFMFSFVPTADMWPRS